MIDYAKRCLYNAGTDRQCHFVEGHGGQHQSAQQHEAWTRINRNPTLEDIRRVVREEIKAALTKQWDEMEQPRKTGCRRKIVDEWWKFCGETDMGQTCPVLCTECGGTYRLAPQEGVSRD